MLKTSLFLGAILSFGITVGSSAGVLDSVVDYRENSATLKVQAEKTIHDRFKTLERRKGTGEVDEFSFYKFVEKVTKYPCLANALEKLADLGVKVVVMSGDRNSSWYQENLAYIGIDSSVYEIAEFLDDDCAVERFLNELGHP